MIYVIACFAGFGQLPPMPRYFFHLRAPTGRLIQDEEGVELPDLDCAAREAAEAALSFSNDSELGGHDYSGWFFEIRSNSGSLNVPAFEMKTARPFGPRREAG